MKSGKTIWVISLLLLFIGSYSREVIFRSVNDYLAGKDFFYAKTMEIEFLQSQSTQQLVKLKYLMTVAYSIFFMGTTLFGLKKSFLQNLPFILALLVYATLLLFAFFSLLFALLTDSFAEVYPILRKLVGLIHNPILFILLSISQLGINALNHTKPSP